MRKKNKKQTQKGTHPVLGDVWWHLLGDNDRKIIIFLQLYHLKSDSTIWRDVQDEYNLSWDEHKNAFMFTAEVLKLKWSRRHVLGSLEQERINVICSIVWRLSHYVIHGQKSKRAKFTILSLLSIMGQSWTSLSPFMQKEEDSMFLWVSYKTALWRMSSSSCIKGMRDWVIDLHLHVMSAITTHPLVSVFFFFFFAQWPTLGL